MSVSQRIDVQDEGIETNYVIRFPKANKYVGENGRLVSSLREAKRFNELKIANVSSVTLETMGAIVQPVIVRQVVTTYVELEQTKDDLNREYHRLKSRLARIEGRLEQHAFKE